jgi:hypothetical protein
VLVVNYENVVCLCVFMKVKNGYVCERERWAGGGFWYICL